MAIVPDLSGTRPGRPGNIPLSDPRNRSLRERRANQDDSYDAQTNVILVLGNQLVIDADKTRNAILFMIPEEADTVYVSTTPLTAAGGIPVVGTVGLELKGKAAENAFYCYGVSGVVLTVMVG